MSDDPIRKWILSEGKATKITRISPIGGGCINLASRCDTDAGSFFVKTNRGVGPSMFESEVLCVSAMYETGSVRVPKPFKFGALPTGGSYINMEYSEFGSSRDNLARASDYWPSTGYSCCHSYCEVHSQGFQLFRRCTCTICLGEYQEKEVLRIMPKCGHSFHLSCIDAWLRKQSTCPVCRLSVDGHSRMKHARPAMLEMEQAANTPEIQIEHSQQWLLPAAEQTENNGSNQGRTEAFSENPQPFRSGVAEARS